jgi:hypothetical protein
MRLSSTLVFDDLIVGTATTSYSSAAFNDVLGQGDSIAIQACTRGVSGTTPGIAIQAEHSSDGQMWLNVGTTGPEISTTIASDQSYYGRTTGGFGGPPLPLAFVRLRITLTGTNPQCYLKLYVTGRNIAG